MKKKQEYRFEKNETCIYMYLSIDLIISEGDSGYMTIASAMLEFGQDYYYIIIHSISN